MDSEFDPPRGPPWLPEGCRLYIPDKISPPGGWHKILCRPAHGIVSSSEHTIRSYQVCNYGIWRQPAHTFAPNQRLLKFGHALGWHANRGLISQVFSFSFLLSLSLLEASSRLTPRIGRSGGMEEEGGILHGNLGRGHDFNCVLESGVQLRPFP